MKTFKEYLMKKLPNISKHNKSIFEILGKNNSEIWRCSNLKESSFEEFIKNNNIKEISEELYNAYIDYNFCDGKRSYKHYQNMIYETISKSLSARKLYDKLKEKYNNIFNPNFVNKYEETQFTFNVKTENDLTKFFENEDILHLLNMYNYYVYSRDIVDENTFTITLEPYKSKDVTDYVYEKCNGVVYHVTDKKLYEQIKNTELIPKWKTGNRFRDGRIFFIVSNDIDDVKHSLRSIYNTSEKIINPTYLKIDLKKYKNKLRFRIDPSAIGYRALFTEEPIPSYCIIETYDNVKDIK